MKMAIDFLIFGLIIISFTINSLALGAFWVTPGLRTMANRFVINLLIINIIGCIILAPVLFVTTNQQNEIINNENTFLKSLHHNGISSSEEIILVAKMEASDNNNNSNNNKEEEYENKGDLSQSTRCWSIDLAAALGALSVLLVVGDTWCAVTDPLRYHTRISAIKSWILIASTWSLGIIFGVLSALRENVFDSVLMVNNRTEKYFSNDNYTNEINNKILKYNFDIKISSHLYSMLFSCIYFIIIILLPFGFVCGMYWRIFSEARKNGLRMRQNGSSPLLQSALNLSNSTTTTTNHHQNHHKDSTIGGGGGLTMRIDRRSSSERETIKPLLPPPAAAPSVSVKDTSHNENETPPPTTTTTIKHQNIFLTLSSANDDLKRNSSVQQLHLLSSSSHEDEEEVEKLVIRHVQSTPTLQKKHHHNDSFEDINYSQNALQLPTFHSSPKALSYMTSIRHRLSNASSLFKYREESRAARISILVVIMFLISYLPYGIIILLQERINTPFTNSPQISILMVLMGNLSSPFIFAYRNKRVRRGVKRLFGLDRRSRESHLNRNFAFLHCTAKPRINVHRNTSKLSTYSTNSTKFLTPYNNNNNNNNNNENANATAASIHVFLDIDETKSSKSKDIERIHNNITTPSIISAIHEKRSILKIVCDSSRKLGGCATNSCTNSDNEQVDV